MWTYSQKSGELSRDGVVVGVGYSGHDNCRNDPDKQAEPNNGPLPRGRYYIGEPRDTEAHGPIVMSLIPYPDNQMFGRSGFLIHGDSVLRPGTASKGCIIMLRSIRMAVTESADHELEVVK